MNENGVHRWKSRYPDSPTRGKSGGTWRRGEKRKKEKGNEERWTSKAGPMLIYTGYERKALRAAERGGKKKQTVGEREREKREAFHTCINANIFHRSA